MLLWNVTYVFELENYSLSVILTQTQMQEQWATTSSTLHV